MSSFGDAISFVPAKKSSKKIKSSKFVKQTKGKVGRNGKQTKGKGKKIMDPEPAVLGTSKQPKKKEEAIDLEQHFVLRMPPGPAMALRRDVSSGAMNLKEKLAIELEHDMRKARVTYGGQVMNAKLVDLPAVVQCMKTTDMKTFYTISDICQMLVCVSDEEESHEDLSKKKDKDHKYKWNHGITPPLKNVRKRRFRKTMKKKTDAQPDIEKELRRLFRTDCEAIDVKWEVVVEDPTSNNPDTDNKQVLVQGGTGNMEDDVKDLDRSLMDLAEEEIFGEMSSSEDEDDEDKDINVESDEDTRAGPSSAAGVDADFSQTGNDSTNMSDGGDVNLNAKMQELERTISELSQKKSDLEMKLEGTDNYLLKERLEGELEHINTQKNEKEQEYHILSSMFNQ